MSLNSFPSVQIGNGRHGRITGKDESHHLFRPAFFEEAGRFFKGCARRCNIIRWSDNTAANLILQEIGGVENFKVALKNIGDKTTKPARNEPELSLFNPKDNRDTSTPRQMVKNLQVYIFGDILSDDKKKLLIDWMSDNSITDTLIKAETPQGWKVIDKSGSGDYGARNDIAVIYPPNRKPIVMAIMSRRTEKNAKSDDAMIAEAAKRIFDNLVF